jgi:hypothetical protein
LWDADDLSRREPGVLHAYGLVAADEVREVCGGGSAGTRASPAVAATGRTTNERIIMTMEVTNTTTAVATRAEVEHAVRDLEEVSALLDGQLGSEFADAALAWICAVERVQRLSRSWDAAKSPGEQLGEALHAVLGGVTEVFAMFATSSARPRSFSDFATRAKVRALKAVEGKE